MVQVHLIIDLVTPGVGRRRAEQKATLPGVPSAGDAVWVAKVLALRVSTVSWMVREKRVMVFLTRADSNPSSVIDHDGELELPDYFIDDLREASWTIGDYE
jgi:hypothetical protein